jgi:hypothetical protein
MLDIYNHLAVFGLMVVALFIFYGIRYNDNLKESPFIFLLTTTIVAVIIQVSCEITAWSIWYLSGAPS